MEIVARCRDSVRTRMQFRFWLALLVPRIVAFFRGRRSGCSGTELPPFWDESGVREPRRPSPLAGAGAVALPLPDCA
jgi:hypothetical protein